MRDSVSPRFKGAVYIAESSAGNTVEAFDNFKYQRVVNEFGAQKVHLLDLNEEGKYQVIPIMDADLHPTPVRLAAPPFRSRTWHWAHLCEVPRS